MRWWHAAAAGMGYRHMRKRTGELRIIGGTWRSRRIRFPGGPELRPTPDRVRETLFNWLGSWVEGRRVLDLFAGSGALGLEALSRGAAEAVFVERSRVAADALRANAAALGASGVTVVCNEALNFLRREKGGFDLVFIDPPYASDLARPVLKRLLSGHILCEGGYVYLEEGGNAGAASISEICPGLRVYREVHAGTVYGRLLH